MIVNGAEGRRVRSGGVGEWLCSSLLQWASYWTPDAKGKKLEPTKSLSLHLKKETRACATNSFFPLNVKS